MYSSSRRPLCLITFAVVGLGLAQHQAQAFDTDISRDSTFRSGETWLAVNPIDPENLIATYAQIAVINNIEDQTIPKPEQEWPGSRCGVAVSHNRGATWQPQILPVTDAVYSGCQDPVVVFGSDGTAYAAAGVFSGPVPLVLNEVRVITSNNGGTTWSAPPANAIGWESILAGLQDGKTYPLPGFAGPAGRPWLALDDSTGALYVSSVSHASSDPNEPQSGVGGGQRFLVVSHDRGVNWDEVRPIDSSAYPGGGAGTIAAGHSRIAAAYPTATAPSPAQCPCAVFETSADEGLTWDRHLVPLTDGMNSAMEPVVAADPTNPNRYAVLVLNQSKSSLDVYVTNDSGTVWSGPAVLGESPPQARNLPWLAYSPTGALGAVWRTTHADNSYSVWAAVSRVGNTDFDSPVPISSAPSPPPEPNVAGDDYSHVTLDDKFLHAGWGDWRSGHLDAWYGHFQYSP